MRLVYYRPQAILSVENQDLPGIEKFSRFFDLYNSRIMLVDRTQTLRIPVSHTSLFPVPPLRPFSKTYEEICVARASEILARADALDVNVYVSWSGGIDSTLVLVSLLMQATPAQKKRIIVILTEESIAENPRFWNEHVHGNLRVDSAILFSYRLGTNDIMLDGEHNDQIFGSDKVAKLIRKFGGDVLHKPYSRELFSTFWGESLPDKQTTDFYLDLFEHLSGAAPVSISTNFLYLWNR